MYKRQGLNETRWSQVVNGTYENLSVIDWTPSWADQVGAYVYPGKAYGLVIQNVLMPVSYTHLDVYKRQHYA